MRSSKLSEFNKELQYLVSLLSCLLIRFGRILLGLVFNGFKLV